MSLIFSNVTISINDTTVFSNINLTLEEKQIAIVGSNGTGKSTLARAACGIIPLEDGKITAYGEDIENKQDLWKDVNMTFQIPDRQILMPNVEEELQFGFENSNFDNNDIKRKIAEGLDILGVKGSHPCHNLSEGKKRMLCLLSIVFLEPKTIFLDEPTTFLDYPNQRKFMEYLKHLSQQIIFITQNLEEAKNFSHGICILNGTIAFEGTGKDVVRFYKKHC